MEKMKFNLGNTINKNSRPLKNLKYRNPNAEYAGDKFERGNMIEMNSLEEGGGSGMGQVQNSEDLIAEIESQTGLDVPPEVQTEIRNAEAAAEGGAGSLIAYAYQTGSRIWRDNNRSADDYEDLFFDGLSRDAPGADKILKGQITDPVVIQNVIETLRGDNGGWLAKKDENRWIRNREQGIKSLIEQLKKIKQTGDILSSGLDRASRGLTDHQKDTELSKLIDQMVKAGRATKTQMDRADVLANELKNRTNKWAYTKDFIRLYFYSDAQRSKSRAIYEQRKNDPNRDAAYQDYSRRMIKLIDIINRYKGVGRDGTPNETGGTIPPNVPPGAASQAGMSKVITYGMVALLLGYLVNMYMKKGK